MVFEAPASQPPVRYAALPWTTEGSCRQHSFFPFSISQRRLNSRASGQIQSAEYNHAVRLVIPVRATHHARSPPVCTTPFFPISRNSPSRRRPIAASLSAPHPPLPLRLVCRQEEAAALGIQANARKGDTTGETIQTLECRRNSDASRTACTSRIHVRSKWASYAPCIRFHQSDSREHDDR